MDAKQIEKIRPQIAGVLLEIKIAVESVMTASTDIYATDPPLLRAISPLAEGADQVFAEEAIRLGFDLQTPLPFPPEEYKKDFENPATGGVFDKLLPKAVFQLEGETDKDGKHLSVAYETVGRIVLDHCDLLIAVWDGKPADGIGGTAHIIELARQRGIPVACYGIGGFPDTFYSQGDPAEGTRLIPGLCAKAVTHTFTPPWLAARDPNDPDVTGSYLEKARGNASVLGMLWSAFIGIMRVGAKLTPPGAAALQDSVFRPEHNWIDAIANRLSGLYRGAFLANYALGVWAVFFALLGYADPNHRLIGLGREVAANKNGIIWLSTEFAALVIILSLMFALNRYQWHYRSVDCRYLAEQFRILSYIYPLGLTAPRLRLPAHQPQNEVQRSWMEWRLRSHLRQQPLPVICWSSVDANAYYKDVVRLWLEEQRIYHKRNHKSLETIEHRLDLLVKVFFTIAAVGCLLHFVFHEPPMARWLTLCAAGFPAAAAACHAIANQGEFRRLAERSGAMCESLVQIRDRLDKRSASGAIPPSFLREQCEMLGALMIEEVVDWQILYRKPVPPG